MRHWATCDRPSGSVQAAEQVLFSQYLARLNDQGNPTNWQWVERTNVSSSYFLADLEFTLKLAMTGHLFKTG
ncbi:MAG TPA: hypothetical protein V6D26_07835 [Stenomitos sp.]